MPIHQNNNFAGRSKNAALGRDNPGLCRIWLWNKLSADVHGYPQCRLEASAVEHIFRQRGIRVIAPERSGFGVSTVRSNRRIMDWPVNFQPLAHHLSLSHFAVIGGSGGGLYALACAQVLLSERLEFAAAHDGYVKLLSNSPSFKLYEGDTHFTMHRHLDEILSELILESS